MYFHVPDKKNSELLGSINKFAFILGDTNMSAVVFHVSEPVELVVDGIGKKKFITSFCKNQFLASENFRPYANKHGVYVFSLRSGRGFTPWYVGKTNGKNGMTQECMTDHKVNKYNEAMRLSNGTPVLFFIVRPGKKNVASKKIVADMERQLIQDAVSKNPRVFCTRNTKNIPAWSIKGVVRSNAGKPSVIESAFRKSMGI